jgi:hypothetical protein
MCVKIPSRAIFMDRIKTNVFDVLLIILFVSLTQFPYLYASLQSEQTLLFSGFLFNPLDGNTYLSKMRQGWDGKWLFELTYSPEKNQPAFLFVFYLFLGHVARLFHLNLVLTYHLARLFTSFAVILALKSFYQWCFDQKRIVKIALIWAIFGAGIGWIALPFGSFAPDFWIAEGYVFLATFANPHFPLAIAIMVWMMTLSREAVEHPLQAWFALLAGLVLANLSPFAWVITSLVFCVYLGVVNWRNDRDTLQAVLLRFGGFCLGGVPFLIYQFWVVRQDMVLAEWNRQNVTPSPEFWEFLVGYFPLAIWAFWGGMKAIRHREPRALMPLIWFGVSLVLIYFPSSLQRRFMIGLYVPLVALAMHAIEGDTVQHDVALGRTSRGFWLNLSLLISLVTNIVLLFATLQAVQKRDNVIFLYREEVQAFDWLRENLPEDAVILAAPESGSFLPAWTGLRVVYGHPFESIQSENRKQLVERFYQGKFSLSEQKKFLAENSVTAILWGMRERVIANPEVEYILKQTCPIGYRSEQITIYLVVP